MTLPAATPQDGSGPGQSFMDRDTLPLDRPELKRPFVDRQPELDLIKNKLENGGVEGKQIRAGLVCFWGAFGMGKSWLLKELERVFAYPWPRGSSHPAAAARLDLSREKSPSLWSQNGFGCERLISELWRQLAEQLGEALPMESGASLDERARSFVEQVTAWAVEKCTPVLLLDTVDDLIDGDPAAFTWLERHMIEPLGITNRVVFVFSSRGVINKWGPLQVRRRIHSHKLAGFDEKTAGEAVESSEQAGRYLVRHTFGHPFAAERLASFLQNKHGLDLEDNEQMESPTGYQELKIVLGRVIDEVLSVLPESLHERAQMVSILRWVNIDALRSLSEQTGLEQPGLGDGHYLDQVIGEMQANHLLNWASGRNCWMMDPVLRRLMAHNLEINDPSRFEVIQRAAYNFFESYLMKYPAYLEDYATELVFHLGWLLKLPGSVAVKAKFAAWWKAFPPPTNPPLPERWAELSSALERDEEARANLPKAIYQILISKSKRYSKQTKGE